MRTWSEATAQHIEAYFTPQVCVCVCVLARARSRCAVVCSCPLMCARGRDTSCARGTCAWGIGWGARTVCAVKKRKAVGSTEFCGALRGENLSVHTFARAPAAAGRRPPRACACPPRGTRRTSARVSDRVAERCRSCFMQSWWISFYPIPRSRSAGTYGGCPRGMTGLVSMVSR